MKARLANNHSVTGDTSKLNMHSLSECIIYFDDGCAGSDYLKNIEVLLKDGTWVNLSEAFKNKQVITDNYNTRFREPITNGERERGWFD